MAIYKDMPFFSYSRIFVNKKLFIIKVLIKYDCTIAVFRLVFVSLNFSLSI